MEKVKSGINTISEIELSVSADESCGVRLGVLGGTFDPVHFGHLAVAEHVFSEMGLDRIILVPAARPPHKSGLDITPFNHRVTMLELAVENRPEFTVSTMEGKRSGPSYSIDTLTEIRSRLAENDIIFFLIGMDAFTEIHTWKHFRLLPEICDIVVIDRPGHSPDMMRNTATRFGAYEYSDGEKCWISPGFTGRIHSLTMEPVSISSTMIRGMIEFGTPIDSLVPVAVCEYIRCNGLFT